MKYTKEFWKTLDDLIKKSEIVIDRPKGTNHPRFPEIVYEVDYGYLNNTTSMDGGGIDVWKGSNQEQIANAIICIIDLFKRDSEIKILIGCTEVEIEKVYLFHNQSKSMKGLLIRREQN